LCIYTGSGGHEWVGARVWGGFWYRAIPLSVSCVIGKREGEEAEVAVSVDRGWVYARGRWQRLGRNPRSSPFTWSQVENTSCKLIQLIAQETKIAYLNVVNKRGQFKVNYFDAIFALSSKNYSIIYVLCNNVLDFFKNFEIYHEFFNERFSYFYDTRMESCGISLSADIIFKW
jgi:hypothetical protein